MRARSAVKRNLYGHIIKDERMAALAARLSRMPMLDQRHHAAAKDTAIGP